MVERTLAAGAFVPNDVLLSNGDQQLIVLTGPNMSGKSTYIRQVALITLMAQVGSFVPADSATIGAVDRIFTRVGLQDDLAVGQSTFMVEMVETAVIIHHATPRSLVILDEIGRGTSTYDGLAIARAVAEYIHSHPRLGCKTLFATHYHELTQLAEVLPRARNYNVAVSEEQGEVVFLRRIVPGGADRSYGVYVARLAGLPGAVINRAWEVLSELENGAVGHRQPPQGRPGGLGAGRACDDACSAAPSHGLHIRCGGELVGSGYSLHDAAGGHQQALRAPGAGKGAGALIPKPSQRELPALYCLYFISLPGGSLGFLLGLLGCHRDLRIRDITAPEADYVPAVGVVLQRAVTCEGKIDSLVKTRLRKFQRFSTCERYTVCWGRTRNRDCILYPGKGTVVLIRPAQTFTRESRLIPS